MVRKILSFAILTVSVPLAWAQNITVAFTAGQAETCDHSKSPSFTTWVIPGTDAFSGACYNLEDIFSDDFPFFSTTSSRNSTQANPNPLNGSTLNSHLFSSQTNYSQLWYQQTTQVTRQESDRLASRELAIYLERDCRQTASQTPHYVQNCRSDEGGSCYPLPGPILSFSISSARPFWEKNGRKKCEDVKAIGVSGAAANIYARGTGAMAIGLAVAMLLGL